MIFFFGTRASKIKEHQLRNTSCPYCSTANSFTVSTYSRYFHFFWIPIIPLFKSSIAECGHCKKSYATANFSPEMNRSFEQEKQRDPAKRPIWQGLGCMVLLAFFALVFSISLYGTFFGPKNTTKSTLSKDPRRASLEEDIRKISPVFSKEKEPLTYALKECINYEIISGLDPAKIQYFTRMDENRFLILLKVRDMKKVEVSSRKVLIDIIEDCLYAMEDLKDVDDYYIGIEGRWNTVLVKTPLEADLGGRFADKYKLLPFYGEELTDTSKEMDSVPAKVSSDSLRLSN